MMLCMHIFCFPFAFMKFYSFLLILSHHNKKLRVVSLSLSVCFFFSFLVVFETKSTSFRILLVKAFVIMVRFVYIKERLSTFDFLFIRKVAWMFSIKCETSNSNFFRLFSLFSILPILGPQPQWCRFEQKMLEHRIESNLSFLGHHTGGTLFCNLLILLWLEIEYDSMGDWKSWEEE